MLVLYEAASLDPTHPLHSLSLFIHGIRRPQEDLQLIGVITQGWTRGCTRPRGPITPFRKRPMEVPPLDAERSLRHGPPRARRSIQYLGQLRPM